MAIKTLQVLFICGLSSRSVFDKSKIENSNDEEKNHSKFQFVSQYAWDKIDKTLLPATLAEKSSGANLIDDSDTSVEQTNDCRKNSNFESFKSGFLQASEKTLSPPERLLCDGNEIEVGKVYQQNYGNQKSNSLFKFIEANDGTLYRVDCLNYNAKISAEWIQGYKFLEGDRFKATSWSRDGGLNGETYFSLFSKFADNEDSIETVYGNLTSQYSNYFYAKYDREGHGESTRYDRNGADLSLYRIVFDEPGGASQYLYSHEAADLATSTSFFDRLGMDISSLALNEATLTKFLALPEFDPNAEFNLPYKLESFPEGYTCEGVAVQVSCLDNIKPDMAGENQQQSNGCGNSEAKDGDSNQNMPIQPQHFVDKLGSIDKFSYFATRISGRGVAVGEVFGLKANLA